MPRRRRRVHRLGLRRQLPRRRLRPRHARGGHRGGQGRVLFGRREGRERNRRAGLLALQQRVRLSGLAAVRALVRVRPDEGARTRLRAAQHLQHRLHQHEPRRRPERLELRRQLAEAHHRQPALGGHRDRHRLGQRRLHERHLVARVHLLGGQRGLDQRRERFGRGRHHLLFLEQREHTEPARARQQHPLFGSGRRLRELSGHVDGDAARRGRVGGAEVEEPFGDRHASPQRAEGHGPAHHRRQERHHQAAHKSRRGRQRARRRRRAGQQITVSMSSGAFDTFVHLLGPGGAEVASDDDGGGGTNSRIPASSGFFTLPSSGTYTIQATSFSAATSGTYTLGLTAQTADNCAAVTPISFGQTLGGSLSGTDCRLADNSSFDKYSFSGTAGQQVSISMSSSAFDTFLILLKPDGSPLASDDDGGGGTNSRIPASSGTITLPTTGTYIVYANSFSAGVTGAYSLTLTGQTPGGSCPSSGISLGQTVGGTLSGSDCQLSDGSLFDSYTFSGTAGQQISVSMSSPTFDTYLLLLRPDNTLLAEDDDGGGGTNSRMPASSGTITLPATGTYRILANSFSAGVTGGYTLTLSGTSPVSCASAAISAGQTVSGALANTDCRLADNSFFDSYSFTGTAGQQVAVSMNSFAFDTYLFLTGPNGLVVDDDDGGGSTNSRIPPGTGFFTLPTSGTYNILANSFSSNTTGTYTLSLVTSQAGCSYNLGSPGALFVFGGGAGSVGVVAGAGCGWSAVSNAPWITVTSGANGTANGVVNFSVAPNNTPDPRTGTLTIAGRTFAVDQATNAANTVQLGAASFGVNESARKVLVNVTRTGNTSAFATVAYATSDGTADRHKDYTQTLGTLDFAPGETTK